MKRLALVLLALVAPLTAGAQMLWEPGVHFEVIEPAVPPSTPGKIEVTEVFSYGCPYCYQALAVTDKLKASLPAYAQMTYVPAAWNAGEAWPMFQRAFLTAQSLGIAEAHHAAMFEAIWKTGELPLINAETNQIRQPLPTIADAARFYAKHAGIKEADFLARAQSPEIDEAMRRADGLVKAYRVGGTPSFVVNGKYRTGKGLKSWDDLIRVVNYLVALEQAKVAK